MKKIFWLIPGLLFLFNIPLYAQTADLTGMVTNDKEEILIGASVFWKDTKKGTTTDAEGYFRLQSRPDAAVLVVQYAGHTPAEVEVLPGENNIWIEVAGITQLQEVTIAGKGFDNRISTIETRNIESISSKELRKAPCCNLSESFQTNGAIDVTYPNALTGVKEIQLLGLRG
ncbi:MAG: carboxypeptidase-like regulatory domain-containing protein, partial [Bacteroidota bacterium]